MKYHSPHWDETVGACLLHGIPVTPCPGCMTEPFTDVIAVMENSDLLVLDFQDPLDTENAVTLRDLLVPGFPLEQVQKINNYL